MQNEKIIIKGEFALSKKIKQIFLWTGIGCCAVAILCRGLYMEMVGDVAGTVISVFVGICGVGLLFLLWYLNKLYNELCITVTDRRVYGRYSANNKIDLPLDNISAVSYNSFSDAIVVTTPTGLISICQCVNHEAVYEAITQLLVNRQNPATSDDHPVQTAMHSTDELKKYKELLDDGVISQEEFEAKKKQLLGL